MIKQIELLTVESALYLKRLVREVNSIIQSGNCVYMVSDTFNEPIFKASYDSALNAIRVKDRKGNSHISKAMQFMDNYGRTICASRVK